MLGSPHLESEKPRKPLVYLDAAAHSLDCGGDIAHVDLSEDQASAMFRAGKQEVALQVLATASGGGNVLRYGADPKPSVHA